jgi:UDP-2,3-diacylglucosamine pyrophosphatase LpxH
MFSYNQRIDRVYRSSAALELDSRSKIVIMSDVHRGSGSFADDFANNKIIYYAALEQYNRSKFTYIELGDGDELWKNKRMSELYVVHSDVYALLEQFRRENRLYMFFGNHDMLKKTKPKLLATYNSPAESKLYKELPMLEGLLLRYENHDRPLFLLHGHQADFFNDTLWRISKFLVKHLWKPLELIGFHDPTSAAKNNKVKEKIELRLTGWAKEHSTPLIAGHTHRPVFPEPGEGLYFNDGSCVHPWGITALEITLGTISLVRWGQKTTPNGTVYIGKDVIAGPRELELYLK